MPVIMDLPLWRRPLDRVKARQDRFLIGLFIQRRLAAMADRCFFLHCPAQKNQEFLVIYYIFNIIYLIFTIKCQGSNIHNIVRKLRQIRHPKMMGNNSIEGGK